MGKMKVSSKEMKKYGGKITCRICGSADIRYAGHKNGSVIKKSYDLYQCPHCGFAFVANPETDYLKIYNSDYYAGKGADHLVDYIFEMNHPQESIRIYEWRGIVEVVENLMKTKKQSLNQNTKWLDFGCGTGGLVKWVLERKQCQITGYEEGIAADFVRKQNLPVINNEMLKMHVGYFDIVTAIEVLEHALDPIQCFMLIRSCLKLGGIFFLTTGNAEKHRSNIIGWNYVVPEIHVSFFEPRTIEKIFELTGFKPIYKINNGFSDIITYKVLKNLGKKRYSKWYDFIPKNIIAKAIDFIFKINAFPAGEAIC